MSAVRSSNVGPSKKKPGAHANLRSLQRPSFFLAAIYFIVFLCSTLAQSGNSLLPGPKPADVPAEWKSAIGDYVTESGPVLVLERGGKFFISGKEIGEIPFKSSGPYGLTASLGDGVCFRLKPGHSVLEEDRPDFVREHLVIDYSPHPSLTTAKEIETLRRVAVIASPPTEKGPFRKPDLVELSQLHSAIRLDIRYATTNDFLGVPVYTQARAFLQRPAAEALLRALHNLQPLDYGLLIHDGYRPWYVTKIFWDATPPEGKIFVADPAQGSRHNRGCAVDLTLYDLKTGQPIEMTGGYDEMSPRSFPNFPGGTSLQRWHRDLLRRAMESEGFTVYESEWWHFDYKDWHEYGILNIPFEKLGIGSEQK